MEREGWNGWIAWAMCVREGGGSVLSNTGLKSTPKML